MELMPYYSIYSSVSGLSELVLETMIRISEISTTTVLFFVVYPDHMNITEQKSGDSTVFKSGLGMLVPLKQSSIQRAMTVLGEGDFQENGRSTTLPLFPREYSMCYLYGYS